MRFIGKSVCYEVFVIKIEIFVEDIPIFTAFRGEGRGVAGSLRKLKGGIKSKLTFVYEAGRGGLKLAKLSLRNM